MRSLMAGCDASRGSSGSPSASLRPGFHCAKNACSGGQSNCDTTKVRVVGQFDSGRPCAHGRSPSASSGQALVPLVKTRDFGMTPRGVVVGDFQIEPLPRSALPLQPFTGTITLHVRLFSVAVAPRVTKPGPSMRRANEGKTAGLHPRQRISNQIEVKRGESWQPLTKK